jgi:hypothetical protein
MWGYAPRRSCVLVLEYPALQAMTGSLVNLGPPPERAVAKCTSTWQQG